jgi:predicted nucleic acid-binding protein
MARISLDTNILVYAVDRGAGEKNRVARRILRYAAESEGVLTQQVIGEFLNVSRRMPHLDQQRLGRIALKLCETFPLLTTSRDHLFEAFDRSMRFQLQFWDALIASVCIAHGVSHLLTEDMQNGFSFNGMTIINPFLPENESALDQLLKDG